MVRGGEHWWTYVLVAAQGQRTYVGVSNDLARRLAQHNGELPGGAKATRGGRPWRLGRTVGPFCGRGDAMTAEYRLKLLRGHHRLRFVAAQAGCDAIPPALRKQHRALLAAAVADDPRGTLARRSGGAAVVVGGHVAGVLRADSIVVRLSPADWARAAVLGGDPFPTLGRAVMHDMVALPRQSLERAALLQRWLRLAIEFTATLALPETPAAKQR